MDPNNPLAPNPTTPIQPPIQPMEDFSAPAQPAEDFYTPVQPMGDFSAPAPEPSLPPVMPLSGQQSDQFFQSDPLMQSQSMPADPIALPAEPIAPPTNFSTPLSQPIPNDTLIANPATGATPVFDTSSFSSMSPASPDGVSNPSFVDPSLPLTMSEPAPEPDPIKEELKTPLKAAAPVPGSIGSAISVPGGDLFQPPVQSTSFSDPTLDPSIAQNPSSSVAKKTNQKSILTICVVAGVVALVLGVVLYLMLTDAI